MQNDIVREELEGLIQTANGKKSISFEAEFNIALDQLNVKGIEKESNQEHQIEVEEQSEVWKPATFDFFEPLNPVKIQVIEFDAECVIKTFKFRDEVSCTRLSLSPQPQAKGPRKPKSPNYYEDELPFVLNTQVISPDLKEKKGSHSEITLSGFCKRTPFSSRIVARFFAYDFIYMIIFTKQTQAIINIPKNAASGLELLEHEFVVNYASGVLEGKGLCELSRPDLQVKQSQLIGNSQRILFSD